jgi:hypothetical protein
MNDYVIIDFDPPLDSFSFSHPIHYALTVSEFLPPPSSPSFLGGKEINSCIPYNFLMMNENHHPIVIPTLE